MALTWEILNSEAYRNLPPSSAKALPYFLGKVKVIGKDPERFLIDFAFSYREAKKYGFSSSTWSKIIRDIIRHGFVDPVDKGGLRGEGQSCSIFRLSRRWEEYGTPEFQQINWRCFMPREIKRRSIL